MLYYSVVGELCWLQDVLDTLYWNTLFCVCIEAENCCCANSSPLTISAQALGMSHALCSIPLTCGTQQLCHWSRWQMQWVFRNPLPPIRLMHICRGEWNSDHWPWFNTMTTQVWVECLILAWGDHWLGVSGNILYYATNVTNVVIPVMLGGELQNLGDIDSTERCCKSSWLLGYMPCIKDPEPCLSSLLSSSWVLTSPVEYSRPSHSSML
jgi:hypothetical protein